MLRQIYIFNWHFSRVPVKLDFRNVFLNFNERLFRFNCEVMRNSFIIISFLNRIFSPVPNPGFEREMTCRTWGQYNFETFDGLYYYFPGRCTYTLLRDCEGTAQASIVVQVSSDSRLEAASKVSVWRLLPVEESLDSLTSCSKTLSPFWLLLGSVSAWGKDLLWRLVKAIWLLESITIKYCNYPLCLESICNRPGHCSPEKAADTVSVYGKTRPNGEHEKVRMHYDYW